MTSSIPDGELVPTQQLDHSRNINLWDKNSPDVLEDLQLSETKASQIRQHISLLGLDNRGNNGNVAAKVIRCQCSWNGEEPGMVRMFFLIHLPELIWKRSNARFAILISTLSVMAS